jgi:Zn-dependent membrane protease YugP
MAKKELSAQAKTHRVGAMRVHKRLRATPLAAQASRLMDMLAIIGLLLLCAVCLFFTVFFIVNFVWYSLILLPIFLAGSILGGLFGYFLLQGVPC